MSSNRLRFASVHDAPLSMRDILIRELERNNHLNRLDALPALPRKPRRDDEHNEQVSFFLRIRTLAMNDAQFAAAAARTFAIPNGGGRSKREAGRLKAEGVKPGVSDVFCSYPANGFHGLYIEMKSLTGKPSREQAEWVSASIGMGYAAHVCRGADEAVKVWREYVLEPFAPKRPKP